jgi:hypothetical protein
MATDMAGGVDTGGGVKSLVSDLWSPSVIRTEGFCRMAVQAMSRLDSEAWHYVGRGTCAEISIALYPPSLC